MSCVEKVGIVDYLRSLWSIDKSMHFVIKCGIICIFAYFVVSLSAK